MSVIRWPAREQIAELFCTHLRGTSLSDFLITCTPYLSYTYLSQFMYPPSAPRHPLQVARANTIYVFKFFGTAIFWLPFSFEPRSQCYFVSECDNFVYLYLRYNLCHVINLNSSTRCVHLKGWVCTYKFPIYISSFLTILPKDALLLI